MSSLTNIAGKLRQLIGKPSAKSVSLVAERFLQAFREHGIEPAQIPRLLPQIRLEDLSTQEHLLAILTPELLDQVAKLFGIRSQWLEGCDETIYDYLATGKEPHLLLEHLRLLWQQPEWRNTVVTPLRILTTARHLDYLDDQCHELAPVLIEPIATLGDETIYRYYIYQDGFSWDHPPARIELKAIGRTIWQALRKPIPIYTISREEMEYVLEGRLIPRSLLNRCLITNPSFEDYIIDPESSGVAKESDELPAVIDYLTATGLDHFDFSLVDAPVWQEMQNSLPMPAPLPEPDKTKTFGKQQAARERWQKIEGAALAHWAVDKTLSIADVVRRIQMNPELKATQQPDTLHKRIAKLAPAGVRGKPGRKPNKSG